MGSVDALRELLGQHALFSLGILLLLGYLIGKIANRVGLPEVTGYIVAGLLVGESFLGLIPRHMGESLGLVTEVALGMIAITIGGEFYWVKLKRLGSAIVIVTVVQLMAAFAGVNVDDHDGKLTGVPEQRAWNEYAHGRALSFLLSSSMSDTDPPCTSRFV